MGIVTVGLTLNVCNVSYADITVNINDIAGLTEVAKDTDGYKKEFECEKGIDIPIEGIVEISEKNTDKVSYSDNILSIKDYCTFDVTFSDGISYKFSCKEAEKVEEEIPDEEVKEEISEEIQEELPLITKESEEITSLSSTVSFVPFIVFIIFKAASALSASTFGGATILF